MPISAETCAQEVLEVVPLVMRAIRGEVRRHRADLTVPQFRTLAYLDHQPGASLSELAEHIGLTLPSMSKQVDGLVGRGLVSREPCPRDRRRIRLALTQTGLAALQSARSLTQAYLAQQLAPLSESGRATVAQAMAILRPLFTESSPRK